MLLVYEALNMERERELKCEEEDMKEEIGYSMVPLFMSQTNLER